MDTGNVATVVLEADASHVATARRFVRERVSDDVGGSIVDDLQLIVSELFTNVVEHGTSELVTLIVERTADAVGVTVRGDGPAAGVGPIDEWAVAGAPEIAGRGLGIVRRLADELVIARDERGFAVTAWCSVGAGSDA